MSKFFDPVFWKEFIRVEFDKVLLLALVIFFWKIHDPEMAKASAFGLATAVNHNRFKWN